MFDKSSIEFCYRTLDTVVHLCQRPRLNLKNNPPYILDIIPDIYEKLQCIIAHYQEDYEELAQIEYFGIYLVSLVEKCQRTIYLFRTSNESIFDVQSVARFRLIKLSLIFSHLLKDLEALFPNNIFAVSSFRITKPDAARWWSSNFGTRAIVPWWLFERSLLQIFCIDSDKQLLALQTTIDLTCNQHVSVFEFDVFSRLFQPWNNILETWKALAILHPGYKAFMTYDELKVVLKQYRTHPGPGSYIFRLSCTKLGQWAIGYIAYDLKIRQTIIQNKSLTQALVDGERGGFYLYPNGKPNPSPLPYHLINNIPQVHMQVTQEQYQIYCEMGSSFELCKICDENNKDIQLEPCGHLLCKHCFLNCQSSGNGHTCPFCRFEIKDIEEVVVDPYRPTPNKDTVSSTLCLKTSHSRDCITDRNNPEVLFNRFLSLDNSFVHSPNDHLGSGFFEASKPSIPLGCFSVSSMINKITDCPQTELISLPKLCTTNSSTIPVSTTNLDDVILSSQLFVNHTDLCDQNDKSTLFSTCDALSSNSIVHNSPSPLCSNQSYHLSTSNNCLPGPSNINCDSDLNYAQLDLINSDSDNDEHVMNADSSNKVIVDYTDLVIDTCAKHYSESSDIDISQTGPISDAEITSNPITTTSIDNPLNLSSYSSTVAMTSSDTQSSNMDCNLFDDNVKQLISQNYDMTKDIATLLLTITENRLYMSHKIWEYFMPRRSKF